MPLGEAPKAILFELLDPKTEATTILQNIRNYSANQYTHTQPMTSSTVPPLCEHQIP